ncbi:MAG TPA: Mur ligase family protein, partial [Kiloniellales bacterium]|nr:Mur ligase family protein [Kiloniellales bacterium]
MIELGFFAGQPVAVFGLGRSGSTAARALAASGAEVWAWDDDETARAEAEAKGIPLVDLYRCDWGELMTLVLAPGIPHTHPAPHPVAKLAREHGCAIIGDIELLGRAQRNATYLGVTGTNGKSTTTALIGHILSLSGRWVAVGGNLGPPALELEALDSGGIYVLELSSYQLELTVSITWDVGVLLNISPDHLERHGGLDGYIAAKRLIFHRQTKPRSAIVGIDDPHAEAIHASLAEVGDQNVIAISAGRR